MYFRKNSNWLRYQVNSYIKEQHKDLFQPRYKSIGNKFLNFISSKDKWWVILLFVILFFTLSSLFTGIDFLNVIHLKDETARVLVDQRTGNIATIISITLVVVGFLINNLAVKSPITYRLLFKISFLYPTIYLTLSTIGCFIIISTLRDTEIPHFDFSRAVVAGTYLTFIILFLIGFLFRIIIQFTNEQEIARMLHNQFMTEAKEKLKRILIRKYGYDFFESRVKKEGAKEYDFAEALSLNASNATTVTLEEPVNTNTQNNIIYDININRIISFIQQKKKNDNVVYYRKLGINTITSESDDFIWEKGETNSKNDKSKLKNSLFLKRVPTKDEDDDTYRKYFDNKLEELTESGRYKDLNRLLDSYLELYNLQMKNEKR